MTQVVLTDDEISLLQRIDPAHRTPGRVEEFLSGLHDRLQGRELVLTDDDLEQIHYFAFDMGSGGIEIRFIGVFSRTLGPTLGRVATQADPNKSTAWHVRCTG